MGKGPLVIGSSPKADLVIQHPSVRERHATVTVLADGTLAVDELGKGRLRVEHETTHSATLKDGGTFSIPGIVTLEYRQAAERPGLFSRVMKKLGLAVWLFGCLPLGEPNSAETCEGRKNLSNAPASSALGGTSP